jgi:hypothetical protein
MTNFRLLLAFLAWYYVLVRASGRQLKYDKIHWRGRRNEAALNARNEAPTVEHRSTENFKFLTNSTKREDRATSWNLAGLIMLQHTKSPLCPTYHSILASCIPDWSQLI